MTRGEKFVLALGHLGLWAMVLVAVLVSYGYVQHGDALAQAEAERQMMARAQAARSRKRPLSRAFRDPAAQVRQQLQVRPALARGIAGRGVVPAVIQNQGEDQMKATQAGIIEVAAQRGRDIAAQSGGIVTLAGQVLARHQGNVRQLFADRRAAPVPTPDGEEIVGLVAQVYGLTAMQAASQLARINFAACGATSVA